MPGLEIAKPLGYEIAPGQLLEIHTGILLPHPSSDSVAPDEHRTLWHPLVRSLKPMRAMTLHELAERQVSSTSRTRSQPKQRAEGPQLLGRLNLAKPEPPDCRLAP